MEFARYRYQLSWKFHFFSLMLFHNSKILTVIRLPAVRENQELQLVTCWEAKEETNRWAVEQARADSAEVERVPGNVHYSGTECVQAFLGPLSEPWAVEESAGQPQHL